MSQSEWEKTCLHRTKHQSTANEGFFFCSNEGKTISNSFISSGFPHANNGCVAFLRSAAAVRFKCFWLGRLFNEFRLCAFMFTCSVGKQFLSERTDIIGVVG